MTIDVPAPISPREGAGAGDGVGSADGIFVGGTGVLGRTSFGCCVGDGRSRRGAVRVGLGVGTLVGAALDGVGVGLNAVSWKVG